jgi:hypothetical protein
MAVATFGDLASTAEGHLSAATRLLRDAPPAGPVTGTAALHARRVVSAVARYLDDIAPYGEDEMLAMEPWQRGAVEAREALGRAAASLDPDRGDAGGAVDSPLAAHLAAAAAALTAGRDLLHTHAAVSVDGVRPGRSDWTAVVTSVPVTRALLSEIAGWSRHVANLAARMTLADPVIPAPAREGLASACCWSMLAAAAARAGVRDSPVSAGEAALLRAVPADVLPERRAPGDPESAADLCAGVEVSAVRLRFIARRTAGAAAWSPAATAASWRWSAMAAAVICHVSELALRPLAERAGHLGAPAAAGAQLAGAAQAAAAAGALWRDVTAAWNELTTETRGLGAPSLADTGDLVTRLGRLVFDDPVWTPSRARHAQPRDAAGLAPGLADAGLLVAAVHQAADAMACSGSADFQDVAEASSAGRLYMPARLLPERQDVRRLFGAATPDRASALLHAYRQAVAASVQAARGLDAAAVSLDAPSRVLAAARAAGSVPAVRAPRPLPADTVRLPAGSGGAAQRQRRGPVERAVRRLGASDPALMQRAAAIDKAARDLIAEADVSSRQRPAAGQEADAAGVIQAEATAARLAAEAFPQGPVTSAARQRDGVMWHRTAAGAQREPAADRRPRVR